MSNHKVGKRCIGLHIPKCAGTSLMTHVRQQMVDGQYYLFSSFYQNQQDSRPEFFDILNKDDLLFIFGHSMNEHMFKVLHDRPTYLFTGLRDPRKAIVSDFLHYCKVIRFHQESDIDLKSFLKLRRDFIG